MTEHTGHRDQAHRPGHARQPGQSDKTWHPNTALLERYVAGAMDPAGASSVETHMARCQTCRERIGQQVPTDRLEGIWSQTVDVIDRPSPRPVERVLLWLGVPNHAARLLAATPSLTLSWMAALGLVLTFAVMAAHISTGEPLLFLTIAPLLPIAGIAVSYGPGVDPTYEIGMASPMRGLHLLLLRALAVLLTALALTGAAALALPTMEAATAAAWVLPALALTTATLAAGTAVAPVIAGAAVAVVWAGAVAIVEQASSTPLATFQADGQLLALLVVVVSAVVLIVRMERLEQHHRA